MKVSEHLTRRSHLEELWGDTTPFPPEILETLIYQAQITHKPDERSLLEEAIIASHIGLIVTAIATYTRVLYDTNPYLYLAAVIEGAESIRKAIYKFDFNANSSFFNYALRVLQTYIRRFVMNEADMIRIPIHMHGHINRLNYIEHKVDKQCHLQRESSEYMQLVIAEYAKISKKITVERIQELRRYAAVQQLVLFEGSMQTTAYEDPWIESFYGQEGFEQAAIGRADYESWRYVFEKFTNVLTAFELQVVLLRNSLHEENAVLSYDNIAEILGVSGNHTRQVYPKALEKLRKQFESLDPTEKEILLDRFLISPSLSC